MWNRKVLLLVCILVFFQVCLYSEDGAVKITVKEGSLILSDETQIAIGDSFESLDSFSSLRYLGPSPGRESYILTSSSSIAIDIDEDNKEIIDFMVFIYSLDDAWTEIERVDVDGIIEVSRGMKREQLMDILEELELGYVLDWSKTYESINVSLRNNYKASFRFLDKIDGELESVQYWKIQILPFG